MSTVSTIGLRFTVYTDGATKALDRVNKQLSTLGNQGIGGTAGFGRAARGIYGIFDTLFERIKYGFARIFRGVGSIYKGLNNIPIGFVRGMVSSWRLFQNFRDLATITAKTTARVWGKFRNSPLSLSRMFSSKSMQNAFATIGTLGDLSLKDLKGVFQGIGTTAKGVGQIISGVWDILYGGVFIGLSVAKAIGSLTLSLAGMALKLLLLGGGLIAGVALAIVGIAIAGIKAGAEIARMADQFGLSAEAMSLVLGYARRFGVDGLILERWLGHIEESIGALANGAPDAIRNFKMMGLAARDLVDMPVDEAFFKIVNHIKSMPTQFEKSRAAYIVLGRDFRRLLRIVNDPSGLTKEGLAEQLQGAGMMLHGMDTYKLEAAQMAMARVSETIEGMKVQLGIGLAPYIEMISNAFANWMAKGAGVSGMMSTFVGFLRQAAVWGARIGQTIAEYILYGLEKVLNVLSSVLATMAKMMLGFANLAEAAGQSKAAKAIIGAMLPPGVADLMGEGGYDKIAKAITEAAFGLNDAAGRLMIAGGHLYAMQKALHNKSWAAYVSYYMRKADENAQGGGFMAAAKLAGEDIWGTFKGGTALNDPFGGLRALGDAVSGKGMANFGGQFQKMFDQAGNFRELPLMEQFKNAFAPVPSLLKTNAITPDDAARFSFKTLSDMEGKMGLNQMHSPQALDVRGTAAGSAVAQFANNRPLDAQARVARDIEVMKQMDVQRTQYSKEIRDAIVKQKIVEF